jgi:transcriptional regulator GlxA family with amidase domain
VQDLEGAGEIELRQAGEEEHSDVHASIVSKLTIGSHDNQRLFLANMARVIIAAFDGAQTLDVTGPAEVFATAARQTGAPHYRVEIASTRGRPIRTTSGCSMRTRALGAMRPAAGDTVLVAGGPEDAIRAALADAALRRWIVRASRVVRRLGSVCSGAFVLAGAGLLDGRRAATHWSACDRLAAYRPQVSVDRNAIFVREGRVWTSAGVTTGIDMALAMVEEDLGRAVADAVAARLVLYVRRPGFQSQFSDALVAQQEGSDPLGPALAWARAHLRELDVERLARTAGVSLRTLHRRCAEHLATTPARLIDRLRVEHARTLLATSGLAAKTVAAECGFGSAARMKRAFRREIGVAPRDYRVLFGA